ncbi:MAG: hypothetical protein F4X65_00155 [Chloroflexi bacterium]|nr:hypothetical protein [Chloroflexota bacterium]
MTYHPWHEGSPGGFSGEASGDGPSTGADSVTLRSDGAAVGVLAETAPDAVMHLRAAVRAGVPWSRALLEAVSLWTLPQEVHQDRTYQYLIAGESLDWLTLAERLCPEIEDFIPDIDLERLLFSGSLPDDVTPDEFKQWMGANKHRAYLNYWYGVVVEEALQQAVEDDVRKREKARCYPDHEEMVEEAFSHLYGKSRSELLNEYRKETGMARHSHLSLADFKEFTYWLSKRRFNLWDPARVASDTRKGIRYLSRLEEIPGPLSGEETEG